MPETENLDPEAIAEFDLKHRVTGAGALLLIGAIVLPWLLGPPSEASKIKLAEEKSKFSEIEPAALPVTQSVRGVAPNSGTELDIGNNDVEETVYISKITPLDARGNSELRRAADRAARNDALKSEAVALEELVLDAANSLASDAEVSANPPLLLPKEIATNQPVSTSEPEQKLTPEIKDQDERERELQAALAAEITSQNEPATVPLTSTAAGRVDVGWVVQVGLFTEKSRSTALINELKANGFIASSSIVDTNRGKNTGTRVWLGPFSKRALAISENTRLKSVAGKEGFIRVYP
jgi:cell division septation protein DedD